jgi:hypothetical protein
MPGWPSADYLYRRRSQRLRRRRPDAWAEERKAQREEEATLDLGDAGLRAWLAATVASGAEEVPVLIDGQPAVRAADSVAVIELKRFPRMPLSPEEA